MRAGRPLLVLGSGLAVMLTACGGAPTPAESPHWSELPASSLGGGPAPLEATVVAGVDGRPWLIGGVIPAAKDSSGEFRTFTYPTVAIWAAPAARGPWKPASMHADPQRDGPNDTIMFLATGRSPAIAFGWRNSPTEGYPRPSVWTAESPADRSWTEVLEDREFFGGPNVIGFGGASGGPHGDFVAGTWTGPSGAPVASVWSSRDAITWTRDATAPAFLGTHGQAPFVHGVADGPRGVMVAGTLEIPTRSDPTGQQGALWYSADGDRWSRFDAAAVATRMPESDFGAVAATSSGWIIGGTRQDGGYSRPLAWFVAPGAKISEPVLLGRFPSSDSTHITSLAVDGPRAVLAGVSHGRPLMWTARLHEGVPGAWTRLVAPSPAPAALQRVVISISSNGMIATLVGTTGSLVWTTEFS